MSLHDLAHCMFCDAIMFKNKALSAGLDMVASCALLSYIPRGDDLSLVGKFQLLPLTGLLASETLMKT